MEIFKLLSITLGAILANNFIFSQFLGCCPFLGVSKKVDTAVGMGVAVTFVMGLASAVCYVVNQFILVPLDLAYMQTVAFILVIASLVQFIEMFLQKAMPSLYTALGVYLPLITTNCAVLGVVLLSLVILLLGVIVVVCKGPSPTARDLFVTSVTETSAMDFLARICFTQSEVDEILARNAVVAGGSVTVSGAAVVSAFGTVVAAAVVCTGLVCGAAVVTTGWVSCCCGFCGTVISGETILSSAGTVLLSAAALAFPAAVPAVVSAGCTVTPVPAAVVSVCDLVSVSSGCSVSAGSSEACVVTVGETMSS